MKNSVTLHCPTCNVTPTYIVSDKAKNYPVTRLFESLRWVYERRVNAYICLSCCSEVNAITEKVEDELGVFFSKVPPRKLAMPSKHFPHLEENEQCDHCKKAYPPRFMTHIILGNQRLYVDPECALLLRNRHAGLPEGTPFHGELAKYLYKTFLRWKVKQRRKRKD